MTTRPAINIPARPVGLGVIGLGVMGATHVRCMSAIAARGAVRLAAVCDHHPDRRTGLVRASGNMTSIATDERLFDPAAVRTFADPGDLLADPHVDAVHICTPTDSHADLAIRALRAGKHVLIEKPVAIASADVARVIDAAAGTNLVCMPAMCMRFWPGWAWVRERMRTREFGAVTGATFQRVGTPPGWSPGFYGHAERSGGALVDLHIHDADFILWCFGEPAEVVSTGSTNHLTTIYRFARGPSHVVAEGGWGHAPGFGFRMRYTISFENATAEFDLGRAPTVILYRNGQSEPIEFPPESAYYLEIEHFVDRVGGVGDPDRGPTLRDAWTAARLLEAERRSLETGQAVTFGDQ
ncbi:MAG: Gfo/Idh/MocA family protein [Phycisphaerales bacterium]